MVRRRRGRPLSCVFVADVGSWAVLSAMRAAVTVMWAVRTAGWAAGWCFGDGLTFPSPTMAGTRPAGTVPPVLRSRGRRRTWIVVTVMWVSLATWWAARIASGWLGPQCGTAAWAAGTAAWAAGAAHRVGGRVADLVFRRFPSPTMAGNVANRDCTDGAMEQRPAARKKVTKNVSSPNERRRRMVPHVGIDLSSAPESCGPAGCALERCGREQRFMVCRDISSAFSCS